MNDLLTAEYPAEFFSEDGAREERKEKRIG